MTDKSVNRKIGDRSLPEDVKAEIKQLRYRLDLNQREFGELVGVPPNVVSEWEKGRYAPSATALIAIGHIDAEKSGCWYQRAGAKYAERLKKVCPSNAGSPAEQGIDKDLLTYVIEALHAELSIRGREVSSGTFAEIAVLFYDLCHEAGQRDSSLAGRLLKIA